MSKILVVEDEEHLASGLRFNLELEGYDVTVADSGEAALEVLTDPSAAFDLVLLDVMLPGKDGFQVVRELRDAGRFVPVLMLTARGRAEDVLSGFEMGADDYLPKPFNPRELVARIQAVMRRQPQQLPGAPTMDDEIVEFGSVTVNLGNRTLVKGNEEITLTTGEFSLLKVLVQHPRQPLSRDKLMELARGREYGVFDRAIDVQISRLRKMVEDDPSKPRYIQTVWGFGYVFVPDGTKAD